MAKIRVVYMYHTIKWTPADMLRYDTMFVPTISLDKSANDEYQQIGESDIIKPVLHGFTAEPTIERWHSFGAGLENKAIFPISRIFEEQDKWASLKRNNEYTEPKSPYRQHTLKRYLNPGLELHVLPLRDWLLLMGVKQ